MKRTKQKFLPKSGLLWYYVVRHDTMKEEVY